MVAAIIAHHAVDAVVVGEPLDGVEHVEQVDLGAAVPGRYERPGEAGADQGIGQVGG